MSQCGLTVDHVIHKKTFVNPETGTNTNLIENKWRWTKRVFHSKYPKTRDFAGYLAFADFQRTAKTYGNSKLLLCLDRIAEFQKLESLQLVNFELDIETWIAIGKCIKPNCKCHPNALIENMDCSNPIDCDEHDSDTDEPLREETTEYEESLT